MAQLERVQRHGDSETTTTHEPKKLTTSTSPTMEHYLRGGEALKSSPASSSSSSPLGHHDQEDDHGHHHKKSVLTKVKRKAKKLRHSLSHKKKHMEGDNSTPTLGASMNEHEDEEQDAEYLGAPMYESELAPEGYKETAKLHPRAVPVISEKHVLPSSVNQDAEQDKEKPLSPNKTVTETVAVKSLSPNETVTETVAKKPPSPSSQSVAETVKPPSPKKTITETVTEKLGPAYATVSDTTHAIASKIEGLTVSAPAAVADATHAIASKVGLTVAAPTPSENNESLEAPHTSLAVSAPKKSSSQAAQQTLAASEAPQPLSAPAAPQGGKHAGSSDQIWDKGVSVKEYLAQKFEPGEDERALSRVISDVMSPRTSPGSDVGMVEKVKGAITSLLRNDESPKTTTSQSAMTTSPSSQPAMTSSSPRSQSAKASSPRIPVSTNAYEVVEEENKGRILQSN
ncbi:mucin-5AC [Prunus yedoensis var. nudiflora]|uniref:Mucin-5AC n=1 Tax=Prunus yedoensis var. nudiflora TaxID=2094558 RepID=A0A314YYR5_PRUYE|nr:mucin-5AC [Prunus yedoensis var. nudiflora]